MNSPDQQSLPELPARDAFAEVLKTVEHFQGIDRDKELWNAALCWASEHVHLEAIDEFTQQISVQKLTTVELMDEIYQISKASILNGLLS